MGGKYYKLRLKSILKSYPSIMLITLLTLAAIAISCVLLIGNTSGDEDEGNRITVGVVGDLKDTYFDIGIQAFMGMDDDSKMGFFLELKTFETEEQARDALLARELSGILIVPDNYMRDIYRGVNNPARYVTLNEPVGFGSIMSDEIVQIVSDVVVESQNGMYSMQIIAKDNDVKKLSAKVQELTLKYVDNIINRGDFYNQKEIGIEDNLTLFGYYVCGILMLLMLLWGIACNRIFASGDAEYYRMLKISGLRAGGQIMGEYLSYFTITAITFLLGALAVGTFLEISQMGVYELEGAGLLKTMGFSLSTLPVIAMITMMQLAVYEVVKSPIGAVLTQFMITFVLGYVSGCFYPLGFFPEILQSVAYALPVGTGFAVVRKIMAGTFPIAELAVTAGYFALFAFIAIKARKNKVTGDIR